MTPWISILHVRIQVNQQTGLQPGSGCKSQVKQMLWSCRSASRYSKGECTNKSHYSKRYAMARAKVPQLVLAASRDHTSEYALEQRIQCRERNSRRDGGYCDGDDEGAMYRVSIHSLFILPKPHISVLRLNNLSNPKATSRYTVRSRGSTARSELTPPKLYPVADAAITPLM